MKERELSLVCCNLCPRQCGVNRMAGERGICGATDQIKAARAALHMWEEPCISGERGSGTVFFSGCALHCVYCQNEKIANGVCGKEISVERLAEIFLELQEKGANNINLVTPGHYIIQIKKAIETARKHKMELPIVYNTSGYETVEAIRALEGCVDVYLPDLKYMDSVSAGAYSHAPDYFRYASAAIAEMVRQTGAPRFVGEDVLRESAAKGAALWRQTHWMDADAYTECQGENSIMVRGTIVRHLLLPEGLDEAKEIVKYLLHTYGNKIYISLMNQYTPRSFPGSYEALSRKVTKKEYEELVDYALENGIENGFIQEGETADASFIPEFDGRGI